MSSSADTKAAEFTSAVMLGWLLASIAVVAQIVAFPLGTAVHDGTGWPALAVPLFASVVSCPFAVAALVLGIREMKESAATGSALVVTSGVVMSFTLTPFAIVALTSIL